MRTLTIFAVGCCIMAARAMHEGKLHMPTPRSPIYVNSFTSDPATCDWTTGRGLDKNGHCYNNAFKKAEATINYRWAPSSTTGGSTTTNCANFVFEACCCACLPAEADEEVVIVLCVVALVPQGLAPLTSSVLHLATYVSVHVVSCAWICSPRTAAG